MQITIRGHHLSITPAIEESIKTKIGYHQFDCLVPKQETLTHNLLIECDGDYWHSLPKVIRRDKAKFTYIDKYFKDSHEIFYIFEHEFYTQDRVINRLKAKLGIDLQQIDFNFKAR